MSTLSIVTQQGTSKSTSDVDFSFDALVGSAVPAQGEDRTGADFKTADFGTVFDLDYGQPTVEPLATLRPQAGRRAPAPVVATKPRRVAPRAVRITRRGRIVAVLAFVGIALAVMTAFGGWATASLSGGTPEPVRVIEVAPGQTLYGIAAELAQPGEIRAMVHRIQELNSLPGGQISEGQKLAVPRG
ncbi:MAG: LysM peptidoglycan-binding domain-containing protein [Marmoricola sp.]